MKRLLALLLAFTLLLAVSAAAELVVNTYSNDFAVASPYSLDVKACSCELRAEPVTVTNTGNFYTSFHASVTGEEQAWYHLSIEEFTLAPGESRTILVYAEPPCGKVGGYSYAVTITSSFGRERILTRNLEIKKCQNAFLTVQTEVNQTNLCTPIPVTVTVKNVAEFPDTYVVDLGSFTQYASFSEGSELYLAPNQERVQTVTVTPPCSLYGPVEIPFTVTSEKNRVTEQRSVPVAIKNQFDHEIVAPTKIEVCSRLPSEHQLEVKNLIDVPNTYDVMVRGPGFMNYQPKSLELDGLASKNITLNLDPSKGDDGDYTVKVSVASKLGDIKKTREIDLFVYDCYQYSVGFVDLPLKDGMYTDTACCGEKTYQLNIKNGGKSEEIYDLEVLGPSWFIPEEKTIRLKPSENTNVKFTARLPCTDQVYDIPVRITLAKHPSINETVVFRIDSKSQQTCHAVEITTGSVSIDEEAMVVPVILKSTGLEGGTYAVALDAELYGTIKEPSVSLAPGEVKVLHLMTRTNLTDYFDGKYASTITLTHEGLGLTYQDGIWTSFHHVSSITHLWRAFVGYDYCNLSGCVWGSLVSGLLLACAVVLLALFLFGKLLRLRHEVFSQTVLTVLKTLLVIGIVVAIFVLFLTPFPAQQDLYEEPIEDSSGLVLQWYENEEFTIDLGQYFHDPDKDALTFASTQPAHIAVSIEGTTATLTPEHNWAGNDRIVFSATDANGAVTDSPIFAVLVLQRHDLTPRQWLNRYCRQIALVLLALALVALLLAVLLMTPRKREPVSVAPERRRVLRDTASSPVHTFVSSDGTLHNLAEKEARPSLKRTPTRKKLQRTATVKTAAKTGEVFSYTDVNGKKHVFGIAERVEWPGKGTAAQTTKSVAKPAVKASTAKKAKAAKNADQNLIAFNDKGELKTVLRRFKKRETRINLDVLQAAGKAFKQNALYKPHNRQSFYRYLYDKQLLKRLDDRT